MGISDLGEIVATYQKHGWIFRRLLLSAALKNEFINSQSATFDNVEILESDILAAWFSRPSANGTVAWEIRFLGNTPIALLESIDETDPKFEDLLYDIEARLRKTVARRKPA